MRYDPPLIEARLIKRYKRFLADVSVTALPEGATPLSDQGEGALAFTAHCANPGSMKGLAVEGARVWLRDSQNPKRKLRYSLELIETVTGACVCVNTASANPLVAEALDAGQITEVLGYQHRAEVKWSGSHRGEPVEARFDFALTSGASPNHKKSPPVGYLEVKSVTYAPDPEGAPGLVAFPDAVTARGLKHLRALSAVAQSGQRAILLFCVNRDDATRVTIAEEIDPAYAKGLREARSAGVEVLAYRAVANQHENTLCERLPFVFE